MKRTDQADEDVEEERGGLVARDEDLPPLRLRTEELLPRGVVPNHSLHLHVEELVDEPRLVTGVALLQAVDVHGEGQGLAGDDELPLLAVLLASRDQEPPGLHPRSSQVEVRVPGDGGGGNVDWSDGRAVGGGGG